MSSSDGSGPVPDPHRSNDERNAERSDASNPGRQNLPSHPQPRMQGPNQLPGGASAHSSFTRSAELTTAIAWLILSAAVIVWACGFFFDLEEGRWAVIAVWLITGAVVFVRSVEDFLAKFAFRLRRPTKVEEARLAPIWQGVAGRAGVADKPFALWIQEGSEISAAPTAGHTVAVTQWSLYTLPPSLLEAVLAHELAHHLGNRSWLSLLGFWYSLPARALLMAVRALGKLVRAFPLLGCLIAALVFIMYLGVLVSMLMFHESFVEPAMYLLILLAVPLMAWLGRWSERAADRGAAKLGYGPKLIEVFYGWQVRDGGMAQPTNTLRNDLLSTQPRIAERIRALEMFLSPR